VRIDLIAELDRVALTTDIPEYPLVAVDIGTVVDVTSDGEQYTLEFLTLDGDTLAIIAVEPDQIRRLGMREIAHARLME
jgi:hypothetical protein